MLPGRMTKVARGDKGAYIEYLADRASGREDQVAYLSEAGRAASRWMGSGAAALGLAGEVDLDVLRDYAECRDPATKEQLGARLPKWGAFESPFTAPKDTSTLWAIWVAKRGEIEESMWYGATAGIGRAEVEGAKYGRGSIRGEPVTYDSDGLIVAGFLHGSARPAGDYEPDPHLHCHAYAVNRVRCSDGQWRSMHSDPYVRASRTAVYGEALVAHRQYLTEQVGVGWERDSSGEWRIAALDGELAKNWSRRHHQIIEDAVAAARAHLGWPPTPEDPVDPQAAAHDHLDGLAADAATRGEAPPMTAAGLDALIKSFASKLVDKRRQRKNLDEPEAERFDRWLDEASEVVDVEEAIAAVLAAGVAYRHTLAAWAWPPEQPPAPGSGPGTPAAAVEDLADHLTTRTTWLHRDVVAAAARLVPPGADVRWVQFLTDEVLHSTVELHSGAEVTDPHLVVTEPTPRVYRGDPTLRRWQSRRVWQAEQAIEDAYRLGLDAGVAVAGPRPGWDQSLSEAQAAEVERVCSSGDRISCVVGPAGAGKTTLIAAAARRWQASGRPVVGLAVAAAAARELRSAGIDDTRTVASLLAADASTPRGRRTLEALRGAVVVLDEASMVGTLDLALVLSLTERAGAKAVLVGDPNQIGAVGAGGMFRYLVEDCEAAAALEEVHRFRSRWEAANTLRLRTGDTGAIDVLAGHGRIMASPADTAQADTARAFTARALAQGSVPLLMARTKLQVHDLNQAARQTLELGPVVYQRPRMDLDPDQPVIQSFAVGDIIVTGRNARRIRDTNGDQVNNGDRWRITGASIDRMGEQVLHVERITDDDTPAAAASLPAAYIASSNPDGRPWIEHGIATTAHRAQGRTVDHAMAFADRHTTRNLLYVMTTRGRYTNQLAMIDTIDHKDALDAAKAALGRLDDQTAGLAHAAQLRREAQAAAAARKLVTAPVKATDTDDTTPPSDEAITAAAAGHDIDPEPIEDYTYQPLIAINDDDTPPPQPAEPESVREAVVEPSEPPEKPESAQQPDWEALEALRAAQARYRDAHHHRENLIEDLTAARGAARVAVDRALAAARRLSGRLDQFSVGDAQRLQADLDAYRSHVEDSDTRLGRVQDLETTLGTADDALTAAREDLDSAAPVGAPPGDALPPTGYRRFRFGDEVHAEVERLDERLRLLSLPPARTAPGDDRPAPAPPPVIEPR